MKIYTKTGDDGTTSLFDGSHVGKDNPRVALYGDIDELNGFIGLAMSHSRDTALNSVLTRIQKDLFALGAKLANPGEKPLKDKTNFGEDKVGFLEREIDKMEANLAPMKSFILPGGAPSAAALHVCRAVCRRAERAFVALDRKDSLEYVYLRYLNRLSDYLFVAARHANRLEGREDIPW